LKFTLMPGLMGLESAIQNDKPVWCVSASMTESRGATDRELLAVKQVVKKSLDSSGVDHSPL
jgi:hypothetical protein